MVDDGKIDINAWLDEDAADPGYQLLSDEQVDNNMTFQVLGKSQKFLISASCGIREHTDIITPTKENQTAFKGARYYPHE